MTISLIRLFLFTCALTLLSGCRGKSASKTEAGLDKVVLMLNWYPEAEHGGFYAAKVEGIYEQYGLDVEIRPGGPSAPVAQELVAGRIQFAIGNADDVLIFREEQVPMVALMAPIQDTPRCILVHGDSEVTALDQLAGLKLQAGAGRPYLEFMKAKGMLEDVKVVPYSGVPVFAADKESAMQGYSFSEPFVAQQSGTEVRIMMVSDIGFNPYASCLVTTEDYLEANEDLVSRMVTASQLGWEKYFADASKTNQAILGENQHGMTLEALEFGRQALEQLCAIETTPLGSMSAERWEMLVQQFAELKLLDPTKVTAEQVFTDKFLDSKSSAK